MIQMEPGTPAFDNVDDLLADRIVHHSRAHSGSEKNSTPLPSGAETLHSNGENAKRAECGSKRSGLRRAVFFLIVLAALFLVSGLFARGSSAKVSR